MYFGGSLNYTMRRAGTRGRNMADYGRETKPFYAERRVSKVISGGTPNRTGNPNVPSPRLT